MLFLWYVCIYFGVMAIVLARLPSGYALILAAVLAAGLYLIFEALGVPRPCEVGAARGGVRGQR